MDMQVWLPFLASLWITPKTAAHMPMDCVLYLTFTLKHLARAMRNVDTKLADPTWRSVRTHQTVRESLSEKYTL
eukprot:12412507-Karenia_brevis.AAC.1